MKFTEENNLKTKCPGDDFRIPQVMCIVSIDIDERKPSFNLFGITIIFSF